MQGRLLKQGLSQKEIDKKVAREAEKKLRYRHTMIARTETMNALNQGNLEVINQAEEQGLIVPGETVKVWVTAPQDQDDVCTEMDGEEVPMGQPFTLPDGTEVDIPSETHPNCNCSMEIKPKIAI